MNELTAEVKVERDNKKNRTNIVGYIDYGDCVRPVYTLTKRDGEVHSSKSYTDWHQSLATTPSGSLAEARLILEISLQCHKMLEFYNIN